MTLLPVLGFLLGALALQPAGSELAERLARFDEKTAAIDDLSAEFEQQKHSSLLRKPMISRGQVRVHGEVIRWDTREPIESVIRVDETDARIYYPDQKLLEVYDLGADLRFLAGSPVPRLSTLGEQFEIAPDDGADLDESVTMRAGALVVSLVPRDERLAARIKRIRLVLDEHVGVMRLFEIVDRQGDRSVVQFREIRINTGLEQSDVELRVPAGVRVSRPFGGGADGAGAGSAP